MKAQAVSGEALQNRRRNFAQHVEIQGRVVFARTGSIFVKNHIKNPNVAGFRSTHAREPQPQRR
jgi:hypothetical protein